MLTEDLLDRHCLELIVVRRRGPVSVYITDLIGRDARVLDSTFHHADSTGTRLIGHSYVKSVAAHPVTGDLRVYFCAAGFGELELFENQYSRTFSDHKTVPFGVERPGGVFRIVIPSRKRSH